MSSFCGCVGKVKEWIGNSEQMIHSSGLRRCTNPFTRRRNDNPQKLKEKKFSLRSEKKAPSTMPPSYSTPAILDPYIQPGGRSESFFMLGQGFNHPECRFANLWAYDCKIFQDEREIIKQSSRQDSFGINKYKIKFTYANEKQNKKDEKNFKSITKSEQGNQGVCSVINQNKPEKVSSKFEQFQTKDIMFSQQEKNQIVEENPQMKQLQYFFNIIKEENQQNTQKQDLNEEKKIIKQNKVQDQHLQNIFFESQQIEVEQNFKYQNSNQDKCEEYFTQQINEMSAQNQDQSSQIPTIQIFTKQHDNSGREDQFMNPNTSFFDPNHTFDFRKDLSSYLDEMSLTQSIHDGESSNSVSEVIERSFYNILSECNQTPDHSTIAQTKPGGFVLMKLSQPTQKQSFT